MNISCWKFSNFPSIHCKLSTSEICSRKEPSPKSRMDFVETDSKSGGGVYKRCYLNDRDKNLAGCSTRHIHDSVAPKRRSGRGLSSRAFYCLHQHNAAGAGTLTCGTTIFWTSSPPNRSTVRRVRGQVSVGWLLGLSRRLYLRCNVLFGNKLSGVILQWSPNGRDMRISI